MSFRLSASEANAGLDTDFPKGTVWTFRYAAAAFLSFPTFSNFSLLSRNVIKEQLSTTPNQIRMFSEFFFTFAKIYFKEKNEKIDTLSKYSAQVNCRFFALRLCMVSECLHLCDYFSSVSCTML